MMPAIEDIIGEVSPKSSLGIKYVRILALLTPHENGLTYPQSAQTFRHCKVSEETIVRFCADGEVQQGINLTLKISSGALTSCVLACISRDCGRIRR